MLPSLYIADAHPFVYDGIRSLYDTRLFTLVGAAAHREQAHAEILHLLPDIVLLDLRLPGGDGNEWLAELRRSAPAVRLLAISHATDCAPLLDALYVSAHACMLTGELFALLPAALPQIMQGKRYVSPLVFDHLLDALLGAPRLHADTGAFSPA
jgi:DNA-binding NarL/FixJ family response regulator